MQLETSAALKVIGVDLDPDKLTNLVGISPTKIWRLGELISSRGTIQYKHNGWLVKSELEATAKLEDHVRSVLNQVQPGWQALIAASSPYYVEMSCVIYAIIGRIPAIHFDKDIIQQLNELNASIDVDMYVFPDEEQES